MKNRIWQLSVLAIVVLTLSCGRTSKEKLQWHHPLYMANNDYWHQRIPVSIENNMDRDMLGDPLEIQIGNNPGQVPLVGALVEGIRVTTADGDELIYRISDTDGNFIEKGPVPGNSIITIPVECNADTLTTHFIYFDNPSAWAIGDFFKSHREVINGGFETETPYGPLGWEADFPDKNCTVEWPQGDAHTGNRSMKFTVKSEGQTSTYGATQYDLRLLDGVTYVLEGWVKAENVKGDARMEIIFGDFYSASFFLGSEKLSAGDGTFNWKKISLEFTVPDKVTEARLQTLLEGTGTAWFDDIKLTRTQDYDITATVLKQEKLSLKEIGETDQWFDDNPDDQYEWQSRAAVKNINLTGQKSAGKIVCADIEGVLNRLHDEINKNTVIQVTDEVQPIPYYQIGNHILFKQDIPASSEQTNYIYFNSEAGENVQVTDVEDLNDLGQNRVRNSDFENEDLSGWKYISGDGDIKLSKDSKEGAGCVQLQIPSGETDREIGLEQILPVQPGKTYFLSAWIKCSDKIEQPDFVAKVRRRTLRAQFISREGETLGDINSIGVTPERYVDVPRTWWLLHMLIDAPENADSVKLQLVNAAPGTVWFDHIIFLDVIPGATSALAVERKAAKDLKELTVWQEDPIVKVFQDDLPPKNSKEAYVSAARNEVEPLQLVIRSPEPYEQVQIKVDPPSDPNGNSLEQLEVGVVGYVPINHPSNYYRAGGIPYYWRQKMPSGRKIGSDGWIGMWPDPILPFQKFDLPATVSQPVWIEFEIPKNAVPGDYSGQVQLIHHDEVIKEIPFKVHVWDFELPDESHMIALYDARINDKNFVDFDKSESEIKKEIWRVLADHRLGTDAIVPPPTWKKENGKIIFDFTEFDKAGSYYFDTLKFPSVYSPWFFYLFGWANIPGEKFGEKPYPGEYPYPDADRSKLRPEFKKAYQSALRIYWNHMKEKGWSEKVIFYISDEPHSDPEITAQMRALCDMIHEVDPEIPIYVSTWWYRPEYIGYIDVWGVSNHGSTWGRSVPASDLLKIRQGGGRLWFTTDGKLCTDTPYLGFERMTPYFGFKYGAEAYEFWGSNWYTFNPYDYGWHSFIRQSSRPGRVVWTRYPNGDANFIYPGQPIGVDHLVGTIRLKLAREGVEDYEYLYYLDSLIKLGREQGKDTSQAEEALENAKGLVTIPSAEGRFSTEYLPDPYLVLRTREQVAEAIEGLLE